MQVTQTQTAPEASKAAGASLRPSPYITVREGEDIVTAIVRHRRETGYRGGASIIFDRARAA
jgi:hypothetical protein